MYLIKQANIIKITQSTLHLNVLECICLPSTTKKLICKYDF